MSSGLRTNAVAFNTIARKEIKRFLRIWGQTILPAAITMTLYLVIFGGLIGSRVGEMGGFSYMDYIIPGVIMMSVITNSYSNVVSSFFGAKWQKHVEELLISPIPGYVILAGYVAGGVTRGLAVGIAVTLVSFFFADLRIANPGITVAVIVATAVLFSMAGFVNALFAKSFDDVTIIPTFVLTPLTYLGGVFYSIRLLPEFWQHVSLLNPIVYMVDAFRYGFLGASDIDIGKTFAIMTIFIVVLFGFCVRLLNKGTGLRT